MGEKGATYAYIPHGKRDNIDRFDREALGNGYTHAYQRCYRETPLAPCVQR